LGFATGVALTTGVKNCLIGYQAGLSITTGTSNTCVGANEVGLLFTTGSFNTLIGWNSGSVYTTSESSNICIRAPGVISESNVIRIGVNGSGDGQQTSCFIAGIRGITTTNNDAIAVLIDSAGQLGTVSSSARFKQDIVDMKDHSSFLLNLRPVVFAYKKNPDHKQYGLIAEEVSKIEPDLVVNDDQGLPYTVKYHDLPALILNELQKINVRVKNLEKKMETCCPKKQS
jgi:hypothetical protein